MDPRNSKQQARRLFMELVDLSDAERAAALDLACADDAGLRAEIETLLRAEHAAGGFLSSPTGPGGVSEPTIAGAAAREPLSAGVAERAGAQIGRYKLLEQIGEGGMGTIWMAEQREPVKRRVALKIIKLGMDTRQVIARFEAERQALAMMDHPHIAKVFDAGATETGRPYFVMEYIRGVPILEYCDKERLDTRARLELFTSVCHAIQHAHQKGIIHRDIKPSNVLVTLHDGVPVPKVIDFGIAKATNSELTTRTLFTEHRQFVGTPAYMSPEQAELSGLDIDTRSDIYSLGVLLYELLTGTTPFDTQALLASGFNELLRAIREDEPHKPSTRISSLGDTGTRTAQQRRVELKKLSLLLRGDLDWIVMKCLEKDRTRRYETANGLAADIKRHLHDEPITAGAPSAAYRLRKFVKRNRAQVIAGSTVLTALLVAIVGTSWGLVEQSRAREAHIQRRLEDEQRSAAESARLVRNAEAVGALLSQCEDALRAGDAAKAKVALDAARKRAAEGGAEDDAARLARLAADLDLLNDLDAIDQFRWTWTENNFGDPAVAATRTREALRRYGADPESVSAEDAAARVDASTIRGRIVLAMDWLLFREHAEALRAVLRHVDSDAYRDAFRDAVLAHDQQKVAALAGDVAVLEQPPEFAAALGQSRLIPVERRRELLELAAFRRPSDLALLMALQASYERNSKDTPDEPVRWLQAAIAADPENFAAYTNLCVTLMDAGRLEEAGACARKVIELDPESAAAYTNLGGVLEREGKVDEAIACHRKAMELDPKAATPHFNLGMQLGKQGRPDEQIACYRKAIELGPNDAQVHGSLAEALLASGRAEEAVDCFRRAIELDPQWMMALTRLAELLVSLGRAEEAIACFRQAVELTPPSAYAHCRLGDLLRDKGQLDEAIACCRKAIEIDPEYDAYGSLGTTLKAKGRVDEAIPHLRKSLELRPDHVTGLQLLSQCLVDLGQVDEALTLALKAVEIAPEEALAQIALGVALAAKGRRDEATACFRKAVELDPSSALGHHNLGASLVHEGRHGEVVPSYLEAVELEPNNAQYHLDLALALQNAGEHDAALESFRRTVELDPTKSVAHYNLGWYLQEEHRWEEAIESYRKTIDLYPDFAEAHCNLAVCIQNTGRLAEAVQYIRRGHELGSKRSDWAYPSAEWVRMAEMLAAMEAKLTAVLAGEIQPVDNEERLEYATMCGVKGLHRAAVELSAQAFAADPRLADDLGAMLRFNAALSAALASAGRSEDAAQLDDHERARLRHQAIDWLRADLALHARKLETGTPADRAAVQDVLRKWQESSDLACLRDAAALALIPDEDRNALGQLWAEVASLLTEAQTPTHSPR